MKNVALITGASSGIGRELALVHARNGSDIVAVASNAERLLSLKRELERDHGIEVMTIARDLTRDGAVADVFNTVQEAGIEVEYLINNAGFGGQGKFHERAWEQDAKMIQLNVVALTELTRLFLPIFVERRRGRILNTSSTVSLVPGPLQAVYYATKAYVTSFSNALAGELHDSPVTVTNLMPGATDTGFVKSSGLENTGMFAHLGSPRAVAEAGYNAMMRGDIEVISGLRLSQRIILFLVPFLPKRAVLAYVRGGQEVKA